MRTASLAHLRTALLLIVVLAGLASAGTLRGAALPDAVDGQPLPSLAPMLERVIPAVVNISVRAERGGVNRALRRKELRLLGRQYIASLPDLTSGPTTNIYAHAAQGCTASCFLDLIAGFFIVGRNSLARRAQWEEDSR